MTMTQYLLDVTLLTATSVNIEATHKAFLRCAQGIEFGAMKMLCSTLPMITDPRVQYIHIPPINLRDYNRFMIETLNAHVETGYCLIMQEDGFILDPTHWNNQFMEYDYIGAPWANYLLMSNGQVIRVDKNHVGNGGFSLRSKKLLEATSRLRFDRLNFPSKSEDLVICHYLYEDMRAVGIRFAPPQLAAQFSIESTEGLYGQSFNSVFGFHGKHWLKSVPRNGPTY